MLYFHFEQYKIYEYLRVSQSKQYRDEIVQRLRENGVGTSIYYPHPIPRLTYYKDKYGHDLSRVPQATTISDNSIALPVGPHLDESDMEYIATQLIRAMESTG